MAIAGSIRSSSAYYAIRNIRQVDPGEYDHAQTSRMACELHDTGYASQSAGPPGSWINPKSLGIACANPGAASCGEPIDLGSGNVFDQVTDYETAGQNKLSLIRYYNSMATPDTYATGMGTNWRTNYDRYLHIINPSAIAGVVAERPDGAFVSFTSNSGTYTPDSDVDLKLTLSGTTWTLTDQNDNSEIYFTSGSEGVLQSITQRNKIHAGPHLVARPDCFRVGLLHPKTDLRLFVRVAYNRLHAGIYERPHLRLCELFKHRDNLLQPSPTPPAPRRIKPISTKTPTIPMRSPASPTRTATVMRHGDMTGPGAASSASFPAR